MMVMDIFFESSLLKKIAKDFELYLGSLSPTPFEGDLFNHGMIELLGKERGDRALSELNLYGNYKRFPDELEKSLVFSDVKMTYREDLKAYVSKGPIGLGNILKTEIFRYFGGNSIIQIKKQRGNDVLDIFLEADPNTWYYFSYTRGRMLVASSNKDFNTSLSELKSKSKKMNVERGPSYSFDGANEKKGKAFVADMKRKGAYGGEDMEQKEEEQKKDED